MSSTLHIRLLGEFGLVYGDTPVTAITSPRLQSLLAYLVLHRQAPQSRYHLAFLFWPDSSEAQARTNLRQLLHQLRQSFPAIDRYLQSSGKTLQWRPDTPWTLDVAALETLLAEANRAEQTGSQAALREALEAAVTLYRGELLPSCYDEWILPERERLHQQFILALERLIDHLEAQREYRPAIGYAQHLLRHDPMHETTYRRLMRLHALNSDRAQALRVYHTCTTVLRRELNVEPGPATHAAYERILNMPASPGPQAISPPTPLVETLPLVGRQQEWNRLRATWDTAAGGQAHFVVVIGEAGIGKSRLVEELRQWVGQQGIATAGTRSYAAAGRLAYAPVTDWLRNECLRARLPDLQAVWLSEVVRLLPELLDQHPDLPHPEPMTENWQRQRLFEALARAILGSSHPLLLVIDDLQWCDPETLEWLHYLLRFDPQAPLLVAGTMRPEEVELDHPLTALLLALRRVNQLTEIELRPLDATDTAFLVEQVARQTLAPDVEARLYHETEGNPLFVVEMVRAGLSDREEDVALPNHKRTGPQPLPPRVQAVIQARLAQLSPATRELAILAATIGRAFTFDVLAQASGCDEDTLVRGLDELWQRHIIREQGSDAYDFSHDKIREVAYAHASTARRRLLHRRVARALETIYVTDLDTVSGQIAAHYEHGGLPAQAIPYYQRAAAMAQRVYANEEAIGLLNRALALLAALPARPERDECELMLQTALGVPLVATRGYGATAVRAAYTRAHALCRRLGKPTSPPVLRALAIAYVVRSELEPAYELGRQLLSQAQHEQDPILLVEAHYVLGVTLFWQGVFATARTHLEQALSYYVPQRSPAHIALYSQDPGVICLSRLAFLLWCLGYPNEAVQQCQAALTRARELSHPFSLAYVMIWSVMLHTYLRDTHTTRALTDATIALCREQRLGIWLPMAIILQGWTLANQGNIETGITQMREGLEAFRATGAEFVRPFFLGLLAELYARAGMPSQGLTLLDEALAAVERSGERWCHADLVRFKGELLQQAAPGTAAPEACFRQACAIARQQGARAFELRAGLSLSRLLQRQGRVTEAYQALAGICTWFTTGLATPDVDEARTLLAELARQTSVTHSL